MCYKVLFSGIFLYPTFLKYSQVSPMFKIGDKTEMSNYRPISLLTSISKISETVTYTIDCNSIYIVIIFLH
jgi:hypothetical protein